MYNNNNNKENIIMRQSPFSFGRGIYNSHASPRQIEVPFPPPPSQNMPHNPFLRKQPLIQDNWRDEQKFKKYASLDKYGNENRITYLPPSKHDIRLKLKQIDQESWKRAVYEQQKTILNEYGSDALRYSNYSTDPSFLCNMQANKQKSDRLKVEPQPEYFDDSFRKASKPPSQQQSKKDWYGQSKNKPPLPPDIRKNPEEGTNRNGQKLKQSKQSSKYSVKSKNSSVMPYDSFYNESNIDEVNEMIGPMHVGFESSDEELPRQGKLKSQYSSSFGERYDSEYTYRNLPQSIEVDGRTFHRVQTYLI